MEFRLIPIKVLILATLILCTLQAKGQDYHLSNYGNMPLLINPAQAGSFLGNQRVGMVYRDQWSQFTTEPFMTAGLYTDLSLDVGLTEGDWLAVAVQVYADQSGGLGYQYHAAISNLSYHYALNGNHSKSLKIGVQYGMSQRKLDLSNATFGDELIGSTANSNDRNLFNNFNEIAQGLGVGLSYSTSNRGGDALQFGASVQNLLQPRFQNNRVTLRINAETQALIQIKSNTWLQSRVYASVIDEAYDITILLAMPFRLDKKSPFIFSPGIGYRVGDALITSLGVDYEQWSINIAYDITVSSARAYTRGRGGIEFGIARIFYHYKKPEVTPVLLCPRL